jgi:alkylation response protein AidB-like acyl-CoA dehydrogenase
MNFSLSDDQVLLRDTARALLAKECPPSLVRAHIDDPKAYEPLWTHLKEWSALADGPCTDLCFFLEETGYVAAPGPFFATTAMFAPVLQAVGHELLPQVLAGEATGTLAMAGAAGEWTPNDEPVKTFVAEAETVDWIAVVDTGDAGPRLRIVRAADVKTRETRMFNWSRRLYEVDVAGVDEPAVALSDDARERVMQRATVALSAEMVGCTRRLLDMSVAYAKERVQFDHPIGSFQAIQHRLAECSLAVERAIAAVQYAAMTIDADDGSTSAEERARAVHVAKASAGAAAMRATKDSAQVHGGIGYTWEHDLHLYFRRAVASEFWLGTSAWHHDRLAELLFA